MTHAEPPSLSKVDIDSPYALPPEAVRQFNAQGFIKLREVFSAQTLGYYGDEITRLTLALASQDVPLEQRNTYDRAFLQVTNLWESSSRVLEFVLGKRLGLIAALLLGTEGVRLYHDQSLYKEPGGGITPAHCDQSYWPLATDRVATAWIPLDAVPLIKGPLGFYARSQAVEHGRNLAISDQSEQEITRNLEKQGFTFCEEPFDLGEVSFHLGWTYHRAGPNRSADPRSVMTIIYMDSDMRLKEPGNYMQVKDAADWCPGAVVGERIETHKNPLIYRRAC
jgi:ectoine hydroxylase-related dioxygenase (phytanoyl-CoA dioxygenase family)